MTDEQIDKLVEIEMKARGWADRRRSHEIKNKFLGLCYQCSKPLAKNSVSRCEKCLKKHKKNMALRRKQSGKNNTCVTCNNKIAPHSVSRCFKCLQDVSNRIAFLGGVSNAVNKLYSSKRT